MSSWDKNTKFTKAELNAAFADLLSNDQKLRELLPKLNQKVSVEELREEALQILRTGMRSQAIDWGGQSKPELRNIVEKLLVKGEITNKK